MRAAQLAVVAALASCRSAPAPVAPADPRLEGFEARIDAIEHQLREHPRGAGELEAQTKRIDDLETLARETHDYQRDVQKLVERMAERANSLPPPIEASVRATSLDAGVHRITVAGEPTFGPANAPVTIVAAVQFPERYTHALWPTLRALRSKYGLDIRVVIEGFVVDPSAKPTTLAACAAARQSDAALDQVEDGLWNLYDLARGAVWPSANDARLVAANAGVDLKRFDADVTGACATLLARDDKALAAAGENAAPVLWINGRPLVGLHGIAQVTDVIDAELAKAKADRAKGGNPSTYYDRIMRAAGNP